LTEEQQKVYDFVADRMDLGIYTSTVLHGVTGSGKTEVYKKLFLHALTQNKTSLFLLPEVTLAVAFEQRLKTEMGNTIPLFGFHSGKSPKEKRTVWENLKNQIPMIIIGVHLPILLPIANVGIIIVDEEHDTGYQEKKHPKINSKHAALMRAQQTNIPILFGSATPSIATLHSVKKNRWAFFQLKQRFSGTLPTVQIVELPTDRNRQEFWISSHLEKAIAERLQKKEQTILFINRRGLSFFVQCKQCTFIFSCTSCSVSLTLHENGQLICHYCNHRQQEPKQCIGCKGPGSNLLKKGIGTQKVMMILQKMFPEATIARADLDTTTKKKEWQKTVTDMINRNIDILVGTQTITKGFHFPNVTLVGVIWADLQLNFPSYNAAEVALQQLIQVAGRAGRNSNESLVIIQTMAQHELYKHLNETDYLQFYAHEVTMRTELEYPPYRHLIELELKNADEKKIDQEAYHIVDCLYDQTQKIGTDIKILGPAQPPVPKIKNIFSRKIYIKASHFYDAVKLYQTINKKIYSSALYFTPTPIH
jgi:primosomal protein N' (replication factor Y)